MSTFDSGAMKSRIRDAVRRCGPATEFARNSGIPYPSLRDAMSPGSAKVPGSAHLAMIALTAGVSADWLLFGGPQGPGLDDELEVLVTIRRKEKVP